MWPSQELSCVIGGTLNMAAERTNQQHESSVARTDRERALQTGRERGASATGVSRRPQTASAYGRSRGQISPVSLMRRMTEDMDLLFQDLGFGRARLGLRPVLGEDSDRDLWRDNSTLDQMGVWTPQVETFRRGDKV